MEFICLLQLKFFIWALEYRLDYFKDIAYSLLGLYNPKGNIIDIDGKPLAFLSSVFFNMSAILSSLAFDSVWIVQLFEFIMVGNIFPEFSKIHDHFIIDYSGRKIIY